MALISATALAYEILLLRLFALAQWHHFAYMVISLALLGYGVSGTVMPLTQQRLLAHFERTFVTAILLFGISAVGCALIAQRIPFNPEEVLWGLRQPQRLLLIYVLLALPFFCAASAVTLALARYRVDIPRLYAADLLGAGSGSLIILVMLTLLFPLPALGAIGVCAMLAVMLAVWELRLARPWLWSAAAILGPAADQDHDDLRRNDGRKRGFAAPPERDALYSIFAVCSQDDRTPCERPTVSPAGNTIDDWKRASRKPRSERAGEGNSNMAVGQCSAAHDEGWARHRRDPRTKRKISAHQRQTRGRSRERWLSGR